MYQALWGTGEWNVVSKENIEMNPKELIAKAQGDITMSTDDEGELPKSIRHKISDINAKQKEKEDKEESNAKFLNALTKPYSELDPGDRFELYESDCMIKRNLILNYQWQKMDTLWFQQNRGSHPCMKKPYNDPEIEADISMLNECLSQQPQQQQQQPRQIPNGSATLFRIQNQS